MADQLTPEQRITQLEEQLKTAQQENEVLTTQKAKADLDLAQATQTVAELKEKLAAKEATIEALPRVTVGKDDYELTSEFFYDGQEITIELLKENKTLAETLVKEGIGNLRKVGKKA